MEIPETKRFIPEGFELGTTLTWPNRPIGLEDHKYLSVSVHP